MNNKFLFGIGFFTLLVILNGCFETKTTSGSFDMEKLLQETNIMPIAIIGSGPAGLMAATYGARGGKETYVIEGNKPGGLLMDTTEVENWPGETSIAGPQIIEKLREQALYQGVHFVQDAIEGVDFSQWPYRLYTENGNEITAMSVVIATGAAPRKLGVPGEEDYWGSGVTSCAVCDAPFFKNEEVVVVGGGDSAVEEAIQLAPYAKKITILVRKDHMRAASSMQKRLKNYDKISVKYNVEIKKIIGTGQAVTGVELYNNKAKKSFVFPTSGVFLAIGHDPNSEIFKNVIDMDKSGYIKVQGRSQRTSVPGVFAAGDVEDRHYRQAASSAGDGTNAGLDAVKFLDENGYTPTIAKQLRVRLFSDESEEELDSDSATLSKTGESSQIIEIESMADLDQLIKQPGLVIVDFWGETCPSCKQMLPIFKATAKDFQDTVVFATVDVDVAIDVVEQLFVHKVPCFLVFRDGALVARYSNIMSRKEMHSFVEQMLAG